MTLGTRKGGHQMGAWNWYSAIGAYGGQRVKCQMSHFNTRLPPLLCCANLHTSWSCRLPRANIKNQCNVYTHANTYTLTHMHTHTRIHTHNLVATSSKDDKDRMEAEVGLLIKACTQQIEQVRTCAMSRCTCAMRCVLKQVRQACAQTVRRFGTMSTVQTVFLTVNTVKITLVRRSCTSLKCILEVEVEQVRTCASSFLALFLEIRYSYIMRDVITKINSIPFTQLTLWYHE